MSSASHQSSSTMRRSIAFSDYATSSSSTGHGHHASPGSLPHPSPYGAERLAAFIDVNKALGARTTRQSVAPKPRPAVHAPRLPSVEPLRPRVLKKPQPSNPPTHVADSSRPMMAGQERINPRFSTASAPAYTHWPASTQHEMNPHGSYRRASASEEHMASKRPALRVTIPPSGQQPSRRGHGAPKDTFADLGHKPAPLKDGSGCVIM